MFGMSLAEIFIIAIIAIIFLGPEKLPNAMVQVAKFFKQVKRGVTEAKETLDHELHLEELRENALNYKGKIKNAAGELIETAKIDSMYDDIKVETKKETTNSNTTVNSNANSSNQTIKKDI